MGRLGSQDGAGVLLVRGHIDLALAGHGIHVQMAQHIHADGQVGDALTANPDSADSRRFAPLSMPLAVSPG